MTKPEKIRVMIADDHPIVCRGLAAVIQAEPDMQVVGEASNGQQLLERFRDLQPDVVLVDLRMPVMNGVDAVRAIHKRYPRAGIIILTTYRGDEDIHRGLEAGAQGYLLKAMPGHELLDAIRNVHLGRRYVPQTVLDTLAHRSPKSDLSSRELQCLELIVKGMSNKEIAGELGISESTVKWHVNNMMARLNVTDRTAAAVTALRRGILEL